MATIKIGIFLTFVVGVFGSPTLPVHAQLNENCTVSVLNRTARVRADGSWRLPNVPASFGQVRARATCTENGVTRSGQSSYVTLTPNGTAAFDSDIVLTAPDPIPAALRLTSSTTTLATPGATAQLTVTATMPDGSTRNVTAESTGTSYTISNRAVATVSPNGVVTAVASGTVFISAMNEGALGLLRLQVALTSGDTDGDGIPDDVEIANGLNPNDPTDATQDLDGDGLTNKQELVDYSTNPRVADTDGDGVRDGLEIQTGSDPLDPGSVNLAQALTGLEVTPASGVMILNTILGEAAKQLTVNGRLRDNSTINLTATARGTTYTTSDPTICTLGLGSGRVAAGTDGTCTITVTNNGFTSNATVEVQTFAPTALGGIAIPGYANNVDVSGDYAYVAAGEAGLQVVDVTDPRTPVIVGAVDTPGNANDVRVVGTLVYVADGSQGLQIIDVTTPSAPALLGAVDTPGNAQDVIVAGGWAYVADGNGGVQVIDVSVPSLPRLMGSVLTPGAVTGVALAGNLLVVTKENSADFTSALEVIDVLDPATPQVAGRLELGGGEARDVSLQGTFVYIAAGRSRGFHVVDVSVPSRPRLLSSLSRFSGFAGRDVEQTGQFVVGADELRPAAALTDVRDPNSPQFRALVDFAALSGSFRRGIGIAQDDQRVYLTASTSGGENGTTGDSRLFLGQYLDFPDDTAGIAPQVRILDPLAGTVVKEGTLLTVRVDAVDDVAVMAVELLVNGQVVATGTNLFTIHVPFQVPTLVLSARALDPGGNTGTAADVTVVVEPDTPPLVAITAPAPGATVIIGDTLTVTVAATDDRGVELVQFVVEGAAVFTDARPSYRFVIPVPSGKTSLTLGAVAVDGLGQVGGAENVQLSVTPDPLTSASGRVVDRNGIPVGGATVRCGDQSGVTAVDGTFVVTGLSTIAGPIRCVARVVTGEDRQVGVSLEVMPIRGGTTTIPEVALTLGGRGPLYPGQKWLVGGVTREIAIADFNGDRAPDVVATNESAPEVSIFLGNGDATFHTQQRVATGSSPSHVVVADIDHDGAMDVVTANPQTNDLSVMLGNGEGTFQAVQRFAVGQSPQDVVVADLNRDGSPDLITIKQGSSNNISILRGNGDGTFQAQQQVTVFGAALSAVAVADIDVDGIVDLLVTDTNFDSVWFLLGNEDGTFEEQPRVRVGNNPSDLTVGDLNGDLIPDVMATNYPDNNVSILIGKGDGTFVVQPRITVGELPTSVTVRDFDGDRIPDVITANERSRDLSVLLGIGDGTVQAQQRFTVGGDPLSVVAADLNLDHILDVAVGTSFSSRAVAILLGGGDGTLLTGTAVSTPQIPATVLTADLNRDARPDLVMTTETGTLITQLGTTGRTFGPAQMISVGSGPTTGAVGDVNGDGNVDVVTLSFSSTQVSVSLGNGNGTFQPRRLLATGGFQLTSVAIADFTSDGKLDIGVMNRSTSFQAVVLPGNGDGTFQTARLSPLTGGNFQIVPVGVADLTGDGVLDVAVSDESRNGVLVLRGRGDGTFAELPGISLGVRAKGLVVGNWNGDLVPDIAITLPDADEVAVLLGVGEGLFGAPVRLAVGDGPSAVVSGDVDADSFLDLVVTNQQSHDVSALLGQGDGTFASEQRFSGGRESQWLSVADFDRDGGLDLVMTQRHSATNTGGVTILFRR